MTSIDSLVNISNTTISNSQVQRGVGIFVNSNGAVNLNNLITQNTATVRSRGIEVYVIASHDAANTADITQVLGQLSNLDTESSLSTYGHPIVIGGPAIGSADTSKCPATNQRGETRKEAFFVPILAANHNITVVDLDGACDIAAMEFSANN